MPSVSEHIQELARGVDRRWAERAYDELAFAAVAYESLAAADLCGKIDPREALRAVLASDRTAPITKIHGAEEKVTLFHGGHFRIYLHVWLDGIASPHQHPWAGAYQVLEGDSISANYELKEREAIRGDFVLADLSVRDLTILRPGDTVAIADGPSFIHGICHLDRPGVTLSINAVKHTQPNLSFLRPGVGFDHASQTDVIALKVRCLGMLREMDPVAYEAAFRDLVRGRDLHEVFFVLSEATRLGWELPAALRAAGEEIHGEARFGKILLSLDDIPAYHKFMELRKSYKEDADLRFFLSALYLGERRAQVLGLVRARHPGAAAENFVADWLARLLVRLPTDERAPPDVIASLRSWIEGNPDAAGPNAGFSRQLFAALDQAPVYSALRS